MKRLLILVLAGLLACPVSAALRHRYSFTSDASDSVGGANGTLVNNPVISAGQIQFFGGTDAAGAYVNLPASTIAINTYPALTLELWATQNTNNPFTMTASFGDTWSNGYGRDYVMFATGAQGDNLGSRVAIANTPNSSNPWNYETGVDGPEYADGKQYHYVLTVSGTTISYYINGVLIVSATGDDVLANISTAKAYLGKGVYSVDQTWTGLVNEYRIYNHAFGEPQLILSNQLGPDLYQDCAILSMSPANNAQDVPYNPYTPLSWTVNSGISVDHFEVFISTDPNIVDPNYALTVNPGTPYATTTALSLNATSLVKEKTYAWRVDVIESGTGKRFVGPMYKFTTAPEGPIFTVQPVHTAAFPGETAVLSAKFLSTQSATVKWFRNNVEVTGADPDVTITLTNVGDEWITTLSIANLEVADEGVYFARATNTGGTKESNSVRLAVKRQLVYYPFNGDSNDYSGSNNHGTPTGTGFSYAAGKVGQAIFLSGSSTYVDMPDVFDNFTGGLTFSLWVNPAAASDWARFISLNNGPNADNIFFSRVSTGTTLRFHVYRGSSSSGGILDAVEALELNKWQMFTVTMTETGAAVIYKDGIPVASGTVQTPNVVTRTNSWIGRSAWTADAYYNGGLDEVRIYNYALTPDQVADLYVADTGPFCRWKPTYDLNNDCEVTLADFALIASEWLKCGIYPASACQ
ncbi:MAG TPA: hypothetical protein PK965_01330 [Anaerohalosphaeraceae bacterium]|nr:hypothetical protein [Anaerohalosphaeraceae bacterium]